MFTRSGYARRSIVIISLFVAFGQVPRSYAGHDRDADLFPLLKVLDRSNSSASVELLGQCASKALPEFPRLRPAAKDGPVLEILRAMLADNRKMKIRQDAGGMIRIKQSGPSRDLLNVRIADVRFDVGVYGQLGPYSPTAAMYSIFESPEVQRFMRERKIDWAFQTIFVASGNPVPVPDAPHISGTLKSVTLEQALDFVLQTFPGVWIYDSCPNASDGQRRFYLGFFHLNKTYSPVVVDE
jgi:hypothetical protein